METEYKQTPLSIECTENVQRLADTNCGDIYNINVVFYFIIKKKLEKCRYLPTYGGNEIPLKKLILDNVISHSKQFSHTF